MHGNTNYGLALALSLALIGALVPRPAAAREGDEEHMNVLIILDSSGSMAGKMGGQVKMQAAQRVVKDLVDNMPSDMSVGLLVYGSQMPYQKRDCEDITLLEPVGPVNPAEFSAKLAQVKPRGMTPIGASLRRAAEALHGLPGKSTIVLVSDGAETCQSDPCKVAQEVRSTMGIDVKVHVVGLDIESQDRSTLECVAEGGGEILRRAERGAAPDGDRRGHPATAPRVPRPRSHVGLDRASGPRGDDERPSGLCRRSEAEVLAGLHSWLRMAGLPAGSERHRRRTLSHERLAERLDPRSECQA